MSAFGKYGVGGSNPGSYPAEVNNLKLVDFDFATAADGTDDGNPDSKPTSAASTFGAPEHNPAGGVKGSK